MYGMVWSSMPQSNMIMEFLYKANHSSCLSQRDYVCNSHKKPNMLMFKPKSILVMIDSHN